MQSNLRLQRYAWIVAVVGTVLFTGCSVGKLLLKPTIPEDPSYIFNSGNLPMGASIALLESSPPMTTHSAYIAYATKWTHVILYAVPINSYTSDPSYVLLIRATGDDDTQYRIATLAEQALIANGNIAKQVKEGENLFQDNDSNSFHILTYADDARYIAKKFDVDYLLCIDIVKSRRWSFHNYSSRLLLNIPIPECKLVAYLVDGKSGEVRRVLSYGLSAEHLLKEQIKIEERGSKFGKTLKEKLELIPSMQDIEASVVSDLVASLNNSNPIICDGSVSYILPQKLEPKPKKSILTGDFSIIREGRIYHPANVCEVRFIGEDIIRSDEHIEENILGHKVRSFWIEVQGVMGVPLGDKNIAYFTKVNTRPIHIEPSAQIRIEAGTLEKYLGGGVFIKPSTALFPTITGAYYPTVLNFRIRSGHNDLRDFSVSALDLLQKGTIVFTLE